MSALTVTWFVVTACISFTVGLLTAMSEESPRRQARRLRRERDRAWSRAARDYQEEMTA